MSRRLIPVFRLMRVAYGFGFTHFFQVFIQLLLVLVLVVGAAAYLYLQYSDYLPWNLRCETLGAVPLVAWGLYGALLLGTVMLNTGILRIYLHEYRPSFFGLRFGQDEVLLLIGYLVHMLVIGVAFLVIFAASFAAIYGILNDFDYSALTLASIPGHVETALSGTLSNSSMAVVIAGAVLGIAAFLFIVIRFSLFVPVNMTEDILGLARSWKFTKGNVLRLLASYLLLWATLSVVTGAFYGVGAYLYTISGLQAQEIPISVLDMSLSLLDAINFVWSMIYVTFCASVALVFFGAAYDFLNDGARARVNVKGLLSRAEDARR